MKRYFAGAFATLALATSFVGTTPAHAEHTLCDNEQGSNEIWLPTYGSTIGAGIDYNDFNGNPGAVYVCVFHGLTGSGYVLVVIRQHGGFQTICANYSPDGNPGNDTCVVLPIPGP